MYQEKISIKKILEDLYLNQEVTVYQIQYLINTSDYSDNNLWRDSPHSFTLNAFIYLSSRAVKPITKKVVEVIVVDDSDETRVNLFFEDGEICNFPIS